MNIIDRAKKILEKHQCTFVEQLTECRILWQNKIGIIRDDDVAVLSNMTEKAWEFWKYN